MSVTRRVASEFDDPIDSLEGGNTDDNVPISSMDDDMLGDMKQEVASAVATKLLGVGKEQALNTVRQYGNVEFIRPYFDVQSSDVLKRLGYSLVPTIKQEQLTQLQDLYGPSMLAFTLVALLLMGMKMTSVKIAEGTLMGTAFGVVFGYWGVASLAFFSLGYIVQTSLTLLQVTAYVGYGLFGYCLLIPFSWVTNGFLYFTVFLLTGGSASARLAMPFYVFTPTKQRAAGLAIIVCLVHLMYLEYLRRSFNSIYKSVASTTGGL